MSSWIRSLIETQAAKSEEAMYAHAAEGNLAQALYQYHARDPTDVDYYVHARYEHHKKEREFLEKRATWKASLGDNSDKKNNSSD